ncbi:hypothetical protein [Brevibacillus daliensis]|uniref:hypothetical protein n=1 Tax=Brevibacillus daliensis TaxID=2892995 RepID=UPI001E45F6EC|nr:hypothetical protein [Brevibacillus daliensis]
MKAMLKDVLYVAPEQVNFTNKQTGQASIMWRLKFVDDKGSYETLEMTIDADKISSLPAPRSRVDVQFDIAQRNYKTYMSEPVLSLVK